MKALKYNILLLWIILFSSVLRAGDQPNIILIFIDDLGWGDVGCYGSTFVDTPRIDKLASEGIRFTNAYAAGAVCSPTRCAVQSGQNQARIGITAHIPGHWRPFERVIDPQTKMALPLDTVTVAESLKSAGYTTGYIGKWHLGGKSFNPEHQGYDFSALIDGPHLPGKFRAANRQDITPREGQYRTEFEADLCVDFISENREKPFFLMVSPYAVHIPLGAMSEKVEKYRQRAAETGRELPHPVYAAMIEHCDDMVGRIVDAVEELHLTGKTMIVFTSDNGGLYRRYDYRSRADDNVSDLTPLRGEKGTLYEGGVRIPLIVKYPPMVQPGTVSSEPVISYDYYPTFVDFAGGELPTQQTIDGVSLKPVLSEPEASLQDRALYWHYPHYHHDRPASSIRVGDWKLIEYLDNTGENLLFNLANDLGEEDNLASKKPGKAKELLSRLHAWRTEVIAAMPVPNPNYDPERAHEWWNLKRGTPVDSDGRTRFPPTEKDD